MTTREEVVVRLGLDNSALNTGLPAAEGKIKGFTKNITGAFQAIRGGALGGSMLKIFDIGEGIGTAFYKFYEDAGNFGKRMEVLTRSGFSGLSQMMMAEASAEKLREKNHAALMKRFEEEKRVRQEIMGLQKELTNLTRENYNKTRDAHLDSLGNEERIAELQKDLFELNGLRAATQDTINNLSQHMTLDLQDQKALEELRITVQKTRTQILEKENTLQKTIQDSEEKAAKASENRVKLTNQIADKEADILRLVRQISNERIAPYLPDTSDIPNNSPLAPLARNIERTTKNAQDAFAMGNTDRGNQLVSALEGYDEEIKVQKTKEINGHKFPIFGYDMKTRHVDGLKELMDQALGKKPEPKTAEAIIKTEQHLNELKTELLKIAKEE